MPARGAAGLERVNRYGGVLPSQDEIVDRVLSGDDPRGAVSVFTNVPAARGRRSQNGARYCPGCGRPRHKFLADAIESSVQERTVAISPVGCAVFLYYYLDVGNTQAAHGRASAVAIGQKLSHPESIVVSYQGDGDLASIGIAEILQAAQIGLPITVVFVNNAIYGMTGGQMAPTTLMGQRTATTPTGRSRLMGEPLRIAELIAQLDGPVYVERVALYDNKQRVKAQRAIKKGLQLQVENRGFALIEVLAECPLHLEKTPHEAEQWVKDSMTKVFPLGVKKDVTSSRGPWPEWRRPTFDSEAIGAVIGTSRERAPRFCAGFPRAYRGRGIALKLAGAGGDGAQTTARIVARAAINEGFDATHIPSWSRVARRDLIADVRLDETECCLGGARRTSDCVQCATWRSSGLGGRGGIVSTTARRPSAKPPAAHGCGANR
jgi:2-oxoisovalerate ferredoxin oxidoreductase beta subunit